MAQRFRFSCYGVPRDSPGGAAGTAEQLLAARLMGVVTQKLTDAFFECVRKKIEH